MTSKQFKNPTVKRLEKYNDKDYKELTEYIQRIFIGENIAQRVRIDHTRYCNLGCKYCISGMHNYEQQSFSQQYMPISLIEQLIEPLLKLKVSTVNFYGGGEPMMHPKFAEIIELFSRNKFLMQIITNGSLLNDKNQEAILENHLYIPIIRFSIHGLSNRLFKEITKTNLYEKTLKLCAEFNKKAHKRKIESVVGLFVPLIDEFTEYEFDNFMEYVIENKFELLYFSSDYRNRIKKNGELAPEPYYKEWIEKYQVNYPELEICYMQAYETEYKHSKCYIESTNLDLAYEPNFKKIIKLRCSNYHPSGYSSLPNNEGFEILEPKKLVEIWEGHLNSIRQSEVLNCEEKYRCISFKRNYKLAKMMMGLKS